MVVEAPPASTTATLYRLRRFPQYGWSDRSEKFGLAATVSTANYFPPLASFYSDAANDRHCILLVDSTH